MHRPTNDARFVRHLQTALSLYPSGHYDARTRRAATQAMDAHNLSGDVDERLLDALATAPNNAGPEPATDTVEAAPAKPKPKRAAAKKGKKASN